MNGYATVNFKHLLPKKRTESPQLYCECGEKVLKPGLCIECKIDHIEKSNAYQKRKKRTI